jgi:hypothetical protein
MSDHTTVNHEPQQQLRQDTTQSGRLVRDVLVWVLSIAAAVVGFCCAYDNKIRGDSDAEIAEFDASLRAYIRSATQSKLPHHLRHMDSLLRVPELGSTRNMFDDLLPTEHGHVPDLAGWKEQTARLQHSIYGLSRQNQDYAKIRFNQAVSEYNTAHGLKGFVGPDKAVDSPGMFEDLLPSPDWVKKNTFEALFKGFWVAALSGIGAWIATWLLGLGVALFWWFMMDRLRDISRAIKGQ